MLSESRLVGGILASLAVATGLLVVAPYFQLHRVRPQKELRPYTAVEQRGRAVYIREGCLYCHSQQPRDVSQAPDAARGWGRASVPADYFYDRPHLLGTMRTGPDLFNIGARQPSMDWQLGHLYQPRAYAAGSIMPSYPYLFEVKPEAAVGKEDKVVALPPGIAPVDSVVVARPAALDLVHYLLALNHTYPVDINAQP